MKLLLADDHALFRAGFLHLLRALDECVEVDEAASLDEALTLAKTSDHDLVLVDLLMPQMSIPGGLRSLREALGGTPIVIVSAVEERDTVIRVMNAGAMGYLPKSSTREVMVQALRLVLSGGIYLPPMLLERNSPRRGLAEEAAGAPIAPRPSLTRRQREVLSLLAEGKSNKEIARDLGLAPGTTKIHIAAILKAFNASNRTQAVIAARRHFDESFGPGPSQADAAL